MKSFLLAAALAAALAPVLAAPCLAEEAPAANPKPELSLEQKTLLRCSAAFAIIASEQARGVKSALAYPALGTRGKEYFVRANAQLISQLSLTHEAIEALLRAEVSRLQEESGAARDPQALVSSIMQPCLLSLDASGL